MSNIDELTCSVYNFIHTPRYYFEEVVDTSYQLKDKFPREVFHFSCQARNASIVLENTRVNHKTLENKLQLEIISGLLIHNGLGEERDRIAIHSFQDACSSFYRGIQEGIFSNIGMNKLLEMQEYLSEISSLFLVSGEEKDRKDEENISKIKLNTARTIFNLYKNFAIKNLGREKDSSEFIELVDYLTKGYEYSMNAIQLQTANVNSRIDAYYLATYFSKRLFSLTKQRQWKRRIIDAYENKIELLEMIIETTMTYKNFHKILDDTKKDFQEFKLKQRKRKKKGNLCN